MPVQFTHYPLHALQQQPDGRCQVGEKAAKVLVMNRTEQSILLLQSLAMLLLPRKTIKQRHSEDNATPMPLTVTRLTRWKRIDAFERDTAGAANQSVLKSDIAATASEEVKDSTEKKHAVI